MLFLRMQIFDLSRRRCSKIFFQDSRLKDTYLIINALNKYIINLSKLLNFIAQK